MTSYPLKLSTPDGDVLSEKAHGLYLRTVNGDIAILPGHIPMIAPVKAGRIRVVSEDGTERVFTTDGGLLAVSRENVSVLSGVIAPAENPEESDGPEASADSAN